MDEYFLHFIWQYQKVQSPEMRLTTGEPLRVFKPGTSNPNAGPDFLEARVKIGELEWTGSVEIHYQSSDWRAHQHSVNSAYDNVVLHVVWKDDGPIHHPDGTAIPTLALAEYALPQLEAAYRAYINQPEVIRCAPSWGTIPEVKKINMLDQALTARLLEKSDYILSLLAQNQQNWEETAYQLLAKAFGFSVNQQPFLQLATTLPYKVVQKHLDHPDQVMALVFGQAGFLEEAPVDDYQQALAQEYAFLQTKYKLKTTLSRFQWKYARLRPANFPTVRLAQFGSFLLQHQALFGSMVEAKKMPEVTVTGYWQQHFDFGKKWTGNQFGSQARDHLAINVKAPLVVAYGRYLGDAAQTDNATDLLASLKAEKNKITRAWEAVGLPAASAYDSQAMIHQYRTSCERKRCLKCSIGISILNR